MQPHRRLLTALAGLVLGLWPAGAGAQPRDGFNGTPRTYAGQVTRGMDLLSPLDDGYRRPVPYRDTRYTYPAAPPADTALAASVLDGLPRAIGLAPVTAAMPYGFGSSAPPSGPPGVPGPPLTVVDPVEARGFVSRMELVGLPLVDADGSALGTIISIGQAAAGGIAVVRPPAGDPWVVPIAGLRLDRETATVRR